jgi:phosphoribosylanthranilate isomerase
MAVRVKICCISSLAESKMAISAGADALGLVGPMPSGPGVIEDGLIAEIARNTPPPVATFLLTSETRPADIIAHYRRTLPSVIQLVDHVPPADFAFLRTEMPGVKLVQVIHVAGPETLDEALAAADVADALLLDSGNPNLDVKVLGGTGKTHNWMVSRLIVEQSPVPVFLAGGLNPSNAGRALDEVGPYGLDICSGVRTDGRLDQEKLNAFFRAVGN